MTFKIFRMGGDVNEGDDDQVDDDDLDERDRDDDARRLFVALIRHMRKDLHWRSIIEKGGQHVDLEAVGKDCRESFLSTLALLREALNK